MLSMIYKMIGMKSHDIGEVLLVSLNSLISIGTLYLP